MYIIYVYILSSLTGAGGRHSHRAAFGALFPPQDAGQGAAGRGARACASERIMCLCLCLPVSVCVCVCMIGRNDCVCVSERIIQ